MWWCGGEDKAGSGKDGTEGINEGAVTDIKPSKLHV